MLTLKSKSDKSRNRNITKNPDSLSKTRGRRPKKPAQIERIYYFLIQKQNNLSQLTRQGTALRTRKAYKLAQTTRQEETMKTSKPKATQKRKPADHNTKPNQARLGSTDTYNVRQCKAESGSANQGSQDSGNSAGGSNVPRDEAQIGRAHV